jgi:hypothetical protein
MDTENTNFHRARAKTMFDLNDLIPPDSIMVLVDAADINDAGQIVGTGFIKSDPVHLYRAFLLTPVQP